MSDTSYESAMLAQTSRLFDAVFGEARRTKIPPRAIPQPTAEQLIEVVADYYTVGPDMAAKWLRDAFAPVLV